MLFKAARIGDLAFNPADRSLWGLRLKNGTVAVVRMAYPYTEWQRVYTFPSNEQAFDLDISPDGTLASVSVSGPGPRPGSPQVTEVRLIRTASLIAGEGNPAHSFTMGASVPEGFVFSNDGRYLYGSSYFTGVSNIFRYEIATGELAAVTNAETGFFHPLPLDDSRLIVLRYAAKGFVPTVVEAKPTEDLSAVRFLGAQVAAKYPEVKDWVVRFPPDSNYESQVTREGPYRPAESLALNSLIPVVTGYQDSVGVGARARLSDPLGLAWINLDAAYTPDTDLPSRERVHLSANAHEGEWSAGANWNRRRLLRPVRPDQAGTGRLQRLRGLRPVVHLRPARDPGLRGEGCLLRRPRYAARLPERGVAVLDALCRRGGPDLDRYPPVPGAVDAETGHTWSLKAHTYAATGEFYPRLTGTYDFGFELPLDHSSIWLRSGASIASGSNTDPLANEYLGGFGNNYVDSYANGSAQRYRDVLSMPGFDLDALSGKSFVKSMLEWCLPPIRFEGLGWPGFYASWARPEVFVGGLETDPTNSTYRRSSGDVGAQMDFQLHMMHRLPMMLSVGAARGFGGGGLARNELMISLQVF